MANSYYKKNSVDFASLVDKNLDTFVDINPTVSEYRGISSKDEKGETAISMERFAESFHGDFVIYNPAMLGIMSMFDSSSTVVMFSAYKPPYESCDGAEYCVKAHLGALLGAIETFVGQAFDAKNAASMAIEEHNSTHPDEKLVSYSTTKASPMEAFVAIDKIPAPVYEKWSRIIEDLSYTMERIMLHCVYGEYALATKPNASGKEMQAYLLAATRYDRIAALTDAVKRLLAYYANEAIYEDVVLNGVKTTTIKLSARRINEIPVPTFKRLYAAADSGD